MGNLNCTQSPRPSISTSLEDVYSENTRVNNKSTGKASDRREVASQDVVNKFVQPSDKDLSSSIDIDSNSQTLASRKLSPVLVNETSTIQQEGSLNSYFYSKLVAQLPDNPEFYPEKFIANESYDAKQYLNDKGDQFIEAFSATISKNPDLKVSAISINENFEGKPVLTFKGYFKAPSENLTYDPIKRDIVVELSEKLYQTTQEIDLSDVIENSENLDDLITNMRLAATFMVLLAKINAPAIGFDVGVMSPFTGLWKEDVYSHKEELLEKFFTPDMKGFSSSEIISIVQTALREEIDKWLDVPDSLGGYSSSPNEPIKMYYV